MAGNECPHVLKRGGLCVGSVIYGCKLQPNRSYREERNSAKCVFGQACQLRQDYAEAEVSRLRAAVAWQKETIAVLDARIVDQEAEVARLRDENGRMKGAIEQGNPLFRDVLENCNALRARAWKAEARAVELEAALSDLVTSIVPQEINSVEYGRYKTLACSSPNAVEKARAALARKSHRWIPVSEDDPEEDMLVFVANMDASFKSITIGMFNGQRWRTWNGVGIYVTHWMSLPFPDWPEEGAAAPEEGEE